MAIQKDGMPSTGKDRKRSQQEAFLLGQRFNEETGFPAEYNVDLLHDNGFMDVNHPPLQQSNLTYPFVLTSLSQKIGRINYDIE